MTKYISSISLLPNDTRTEMLSNVWKWTMETPREKAATSELKGELYLKL